MIFESKEELEAFKFVCALASDETGRRGCNDLTKEDEKKFQNLKVTRTSASGIKETDRILYDFDVLFWLGKQQQWLVDELPEDIRDKLIAFRTARSI